MAGRVVLITGGSRGIGAAAARRFAAGGDKVVVNYCRSREQAEALAAELGGMAVQADVSDPAQVGKMVDNVLEKFCQLDILICNAGIAQQKLFGDLTDEDFSDIWFVGDYSDKNGETKGGFVAIHMMSALSTAGFSWQTGDKAKGQFAFEYTAHYSMDAQDTVPFEIYVKAGADEEAGG